MSGNSPVEPFGLSIKETSKSESCCVSEVYDRLASGEYKAVKDGKRTIVLYESIKRRRETLKPAEFKPPRPRASRFHLLRKRRAAGGA